MKGPINILKAVRSFRYAGVGIYNLFRYENNARIHLLACIFVVIAGVFFDISSAEWSLLVIQIGLVWSAEAVNTAVEKLADVVSPEYHPGIKVVKDTAAAAVLILAISAVIVGGIIFIPKALLFF
ncbi:diacylglycerol kinase family protein [Dyadobacter sediminis]|uniref:Diacylglycerol kinase family protein n=1 Tax=Dyadobacter sediminis TaxID=1493691 RepID=A0A5R9KAI0_9BACT|nr:diacylglycerol kinase family protein [Dyadobacter sediminis]TLU91727.1 diacylglycerol kinase family protein [Dyadobacter sediminis]GGC00786.1 diacylglycerol kinase [Dyadobacter sediminis]